MRTIKLLAVVGLAVALVGVIAAPALAQATLKCPDGVSYQILSFNLEDNNGVLWGIVESIDPATGKPRWVDCTGQAANIALQARKTGTAQKPQRVDKAGISYWCAKGSFGNNAADAARLQAEGAKQVGVGALNPVPGTIKLPCPGQQAEAAIEIGGLPTMTEWGLIALAVLLAGGMGYMLYRRRPALRPAAP